MNTTPSRRRWYQFSLWTMFWLILTAALATYGINEHRLRVRAETGESEAIAASKAMLLGRAGNPILRWSESFDWNPKSKSTAPQGGSSGTSGRAQ
jgi:hypothetical protein